MKQTKKQKKSNVSSPLIYASSVGMAATARMSTQELLKFLGSILASSTDYSIIAFDKELTILAWNEGARRIYGYEPQEVIGKSIYGLHDTQDVISGKVDYILNEVRKFEKWTGKVTRIRKDGSKFTAFVTYSLRKDSKGNQLGYTLISRDISEQLRLEGELKSARDLEESNRQLQETSRVKSNFLANMSHELRTPLNAIIGFSELLYDDKVEKLSEEQREYVSDILNSAKHLLTLINDILDLSKIESGKMEFQPVEFSLCKTAGDVINMLREIAYKKKINLNICCDPALNKVYLDMIRFKQILYNLLSNALKFTSEFGSVTLRIIDESQKCFRLEVEDNGIGIKSADLPLLFHEFCQLNPNSGGTGLGLALTKNIVEALGGKIGVVSQFRKGSIFYASLPKKLELDKYPHLPANISLRMNNMDAAKVLIIEDNDKDAKWLEKTLSEGGYVPCIAKNALIAIKCVMEERYDFITLDLILPDMDGWKVLEKIRQSCNKNTPVIVISLLEESRDKPKLWVSHFLAKPIKKTQLLKTLEKISPTDNKCKILAIDKDLMTLKLLKSLFRGNFYEIHTVSDPEVGLDFIDSFKPHIIILDLLMEKMNGFDFLKHLQDRNLKDTAVIVWTVKELSSEENLLLNHAVQAVVNKGSEESSQLLLREVNKILKKSYLPLEVV